MTKFDPRRIRDSIHAYELGLLSDEQRRELELYLLDHGEILENMKDFKAVINLLCEDAEVVKTVEQLAEQSQASETSSSGRKLKNWLVPALVTLVFVLILILKPWQVEIRPTSEAIAAENRLMVLSFVNIVNPEDPNNYQELLTNLLITDLAESHYLQVVSPERVADILNMQSEGRRDEHDPNTALLVARTAQVKWLLKGAIIQEEPVFVLTTQLIEPQTGDIISTGRIEGEPGQTVFELIDQLTTKIKASLTLPKQALAEEDPPVSYVTTTSLTAYKYYLAGVDNFQKFYMRDAAEDFLKSLEYDSTMAMSYYYLSVLVDSSYIDKAVKYSEKAPRLNRKYIMAVEALVGRNIDSAITVWKEIAASYPDQKHANYLVGLYQYKQGRYEEAREYLERAIAIAPNFKLPYQHLAYTYSELGELEKAVMAADEYVRLAPNEARPYDCLGDIYLKTGRIDEAIEAFRQALIIKPDYALSAFKRGEAFFITGRMDSARAIFQQLSREDDYLVHSEARLDLACIKSIEGKFTETFKMLDDYITADKVEKEKENFELFRLYKATLYDLLKRPDDALAEIDQCLAIYGANKHAYYYKVQSYNIQLLAFSGKIDSAAILVNRLAADLNEAGLPLIPYYQAAGAIALAEGRFDNAVDLLNKAVHPGNTLYTLSRYLLGQAYLEIGDYTKARDLYHDLTTKYYADCMLWSTLRVLAHYKLGLAYYHMGDFTGAVTELEEFVAIWGEADTRIEEIEEAGTLLVELKSRI